MNKKPRSRIAVMGGGARLSGAPVVRCCPNSGMSSPPPGAFATNDPLTGARQEVQKIADQLSHARHYCLDTFSPMNSNFSRPFRTSGLITQVPRQAELTTLLDVSVPKGSAKTLPIAPRRQKPPLKGA